MGKKIIHCKFCSRIFNEEDIYASHIAKKHPDMIPEDMVPRQFVYYLRTGKTHGSCVICKKDTSWNEKTNKYCRFCEDPKCKEIYRGQFKDRMIDKYGKTTLLDDPEQQRKMLEGRGISGSYAWSDHNPHHVFKYTGSYELEFLKFLDRVMRWPPEDIMTPSPHTYYYVYESERHFYIPDVFIPSLNLEIEIKDGGSNPNMHPKIQQVDKVKEQLKDEVMQSKNVPFSYLKITDKNHKIFFSYLERAKETEEKEKIVMI